MGKLPCLTIFISDLIVSQRNLVYRFARCVVVFIAYEKPSKSHRVNELTLRKK